MKVAILGYGKEGQAAEHYYRQKNAVITIFDENPDVAARVPADVMCVTGKDAFKKVTGFDVIVRGPAIRPDRIISDRGRLTDVTQLFFEECPTPHIIGVTGTKGKGTTASLIYEILKTAGLKAHLAGNIGVPALDILRDVQPKDIVILELSSFQLWNLRRSPHIAVVLMVEPDHMDVHENMDEYVRAKSNIARWQKPNDVVICHPTNQYSRVIAEQSKGRAFAYGEPPAAHVQDDAFYIDEQKICSISNLFIPGKHNIENACAAITAAWQYTQDTRAISMSLRAFQGLDHRLKFVAERHGAAYYDDSYSSAAGALVAAIRAFDRPEILICGGYDRGLDYADMAKAIANQKNIKKVLLMGQTAPKIAEALQQAGFTAFELSNGKRLAQIVERAKDVAEAGDIVILSPGCASFDMFKDFNDRGDQFVKIVQEMS